MKILWFTWKDRKNPRSGGAELINEEIAKRLVKNGHEVVFVVAGFTGCTLEETINGYKVIRLGSRWTVYLKAFLYYRKFLSKWPDLIIDEINTAPFFCKFYAKQKNILFVHQLARQVWFYEMFFPFNIIGYLIEPIYLRLLNDQQVITVSESTKKDLMKRGFKEKNISIISEGIDMEPVKDFDMIEKYETPTVLSMGELRPVKRTHHIVRAFELAKKEMPELQLIIAGERFNGYGKKVVEMVEKSSAKDAIKFLGKVENGRRLELLQKSHILCATSVKEGWGLTVTEANSQGTPAVVYNIDGYRDSVRHNETGLVCLENTPEDLAKNIVTLMKDAKKRRSFGIRSWQWAKEITFDKCYEDFMEVVNKILCQKN